MIRSKLVILFVGVMLWVLPLSAAAIEVSGGYLNGTVDINDGATKEDGGGFTLSGQIGLLGPLGLMANFTSVGPLLTL